VAISSKNFIGPQ